MLSLQTQLVKLGFIQPEMRCHLQPLLEVLDDMTCCQHPSKPLMLLSTACISKSVSLSPCQLQYLKNEIFPIEDVTILNVDKSLTKLAEQCGGAIKNLTLLRDDNHYSLLSNQGETQNISISIHDIRCKGSGALSFPLEDLGGHINQTIEVEGNAHVKSISNYETVIEYIPYVATLEVGLNLASFNRNHKVASSMLKFISKDESREYFRKGKEVKE